MIAALIAMASIVSMGVVSQAGAATAKDLDKDAAQALKTLYQTGSVAETLLHTAKAVLVFPNIIKAGFVFGGIACLSMCAAVQRLCRPGGDGVEGQRGALPRRERRIAAGHPRHLCSGTMHLYQRGLSHDIGPGLRLGRLSGMSVE